MPNKPTGSIQRQSHMHKTRPLLDQQIHTEMGCAADTTQIDPRTRGFFDIEATPLTSTHMHSKRGICMWCVVCMTTWFWRV
jgi:hypothetical protein